MVPQFPKFPQFRQFPQFPRLRARLVDRLRTANPYAVDIPLAALVLLAVSLQFVLPERGTRMDWLGVLLGLGTVLPLVWRRRAPFIAACAVSGFTTAMALHDRPAPDVSYGGMVMLYTLAAIARPWQRRMMLVGWLIGTTWTMTVKEGTQPFEHAFHVLVLFFSYGLGALSRVQRAYTSALEDRARRLERERASETARAVAEERSRIAREMHDILAHAVSLMVVQAEAGPVVVRSDPKRAEAAFDAIAGAGRDAMVQLRRILGVLREAEAPGERVPQPTLDAVPGLLAQVEQTGLRVELTTTGVPRALRPDTEVSAYRVIQEALTNVLKHADTASLVRIHLDWGEGELVLSVQDDGVAAAAPRPLHPPNRPGHGLIGIRERAAAGGGTAAAGPGPDGGFRVVVRLPTASLEHEHPGSGRR
ncbi:histidine kinase [Streptomyces sp. E11-3]|uniref:sensor histidine kinase n=1 Tax=Streptomyces sp. E11-3 TaxID=3110112 RepID=UPI0039815470